MVLRSSCEFVSVVSIFLFAILPSSLQHPLSVPAGRLNGRAETLPVGFWVTGGPSHEILTRLSPSGENDPTGKKASGEILHDSGGNY